MSKILDTNIECDIIKAVLVYLLAPPGRSLRSFISETAFFLLTITCLKTILKKTMFLLEIIPFIKIKGAETLTYFSSQKPAIGSLVLIKVKNSEVKGLVTEVQALKEHKSEVKASKYALKPISKILTKKPVLTKQQTELADFISNFYLAPKGVVLKQFLPKQILNRINPKELELKIDYVILAVGQEAPDDIENLCKILGITRSEDGFIEELHLKFKPVETKVPGIYTASTFPKDISDTIALARGAASISAIKHKGIEIEMIRADVDIEKCVGCGLCEVVCPYDAISIKDISPFKMISTTDEMKCKGCGICVASCPIGARDLRWWKDVQILNQIDAILKENN